MNWEALGAIGEIVGAVAVVLTLGYLAVQIRQNTRSMRTTSLQNVLGDAVSHLEHLFKDPELARIWISGIRDLDAVSEAERPRFDFFALSFFRRLESMHHHHREGLLPDEKWEGLRASIREDVAQPGIRAWWESNSYRFNPYFREFFDECLNSRAGHQ